MFTQSHIPFHIFVAISTILFYYLLRRYRTTNKESATSNDRTTNKESATSNGRTTNKESTTSNDRTTNKESARPNDRTTKTNIYLSMYIPVVLYIGFYITKYINCGKSNIVENAIEQILSPGSIMSDLYQSSIIV